MQSKYFIKSVTCSFFVYSIIYSSFSNANNATPIHETIVVTANRFEQPISSVLAPMTVIEREDIERWQIDSVPELLKRLPSVNVALNGGRGQFVSVFVRGSESRHVLVMLNGIRMASAGVTGNIDFSQIPVALIQRIEFVRGANAITFGSDAIGGVINIITTVTDRTTKQPNNQFNASYGTHVYQNYNGSFYMPLSDNTQLTLAGGYESERGYDLSPQLNEPDHDGFRSRSLWLGLEHQFSLELSGFIRGYGYNNSIEYDGDIWIPYNERRLDTRNIDAGLYLQRDDYSSHLLVSYQRYKDYNYEKLQGRHSVVPNDITQKSVQWGSVYYFDQIILSNGIDFYQEIAEAGTSSLVNDYSRANLGLYFSGQRSVDDFILEAAIRGDHNQQFGNQLTWSTAVGWQIHSDYNLMLSYGTAFKAPAFSEIFDTAWSLGNANLSPEKSQQWEFAVEADYGDLSWRLGFYYNKVKNLIDWNGTGYFNQTESKIKGAELGVEFLTGNFVHNFMFNYVDAKNAQDQQLLRRPHKHASYQIDLIQDNWDLFAAYLYHGKKSDIDDVTFQRISTNAYSTFDIGAAYKIKLPLTVKGKIANLFNEKDSGVYGYSNAGRLYTVTLSYEF